MIKIDNVSKSYNGELVLKSVSLNIGDGDFLSIMGESGSGKSTLISILGGFLSPDSGRILWNGEDILSYDDDALAAMRCGKMGFVFQSFRLIPTLSARDNILLPATLGGHINPETMDYMSYICSSLGIEGLLDKLPEQLSGGQCQRVAIARALVYKPSVLIMDESTGALDSEMEERVMRLISKINEELGTTVIQVTHSRRVAEFGRKTIIISDGKIAI